MLRADAIDDAIEQRRVDQGELDVRVIAWEEAQQRIKWATPPRTVATTDSGLYMPSRAELGALSAGPVAIAASRFLAARRTSAY
jgi:hypothetical protein